MTKALTLVFLWTVFANCGSSSDSFFEGTDFGSCKGSWLLSKGGEGAGGGEFELVVGDFKISSLPLKTEPSRTRDLLGVEHLLVKVRSLDSIWVGPWLEYGREWGEYDPRLGGRSASINEIRLMSERRPGMQTGDFFEHSSLGCCDKAPEFCGTFFFCFSCFNFSWFETEFDPFSSSSISYTALSQRELVTTCRSTALNWAEVTKVCTILRSAADFMLRFLHEVVHNWFNAAFSNEVLSLFICD